MTYDATTLGQTGVFNTGPNGKGAGIWMSGAGPVIDGSAVYYSTGNGYGDVAGTQPGLGESVIKFSPLGASRSRARSRPRTGLRSTTGTPTSGWEA